ncbi:globin D, coelomic-like [Daphnia pulicaria]|uniref:globin D, coelomic-like n=1 Tax=Daphnia pulicaria TaxID=35523 RepID=UPI001EEC2D3A|nr:globin D, coelomic-like [Daphnia pulicaria]
MSWLILVVCASILSLSAGQSPFHEGIAGGMESGHGDSTMRGSGPFVTTTTVTTILDFNPAGMSRSMRSPSFASERSHYYGDKKYGSFSQKDVDVIVNTWNTLKRRGDFAPKVFIRYFKAKPESQKMFPAFANVPITELPTNHEFLNSAYTCITSLNYLIPYLKFDHPERCPAFPKHLKDKYNAVDLKKLGSIWMTAMQEEMGNAFTNDVRDVWKKAVMAVIEYASK